MQSAPHGKERLEADILLLGEQINLIRGKINDLYSRLSDFSKTSQKGTEFGLLASYIRIFRKINSKLEMIQRESGDLGQKILELSSSRTKKNNTQDVELKGLQDQFNRLDETRRVLTQDLTDCESVLQSNLTKLFALDEEAEAETLASQIIKGAIDVIEHIPVILAAKGIKGFLDGLSREEEE